MKKIFFILGICFTAAVLNTPVKAQETKWKDIPASYLKDSLPRLVERCREMLSHAYMAQTLLAEKTDIPGWEGYPVKLYEYQTGKDIKTGAPKTGKVYLLNPAPEKLAAWIISTCQEVKHSLSPEYVNKLFDFIKWQSSAQFPVSGVVYEDMYTKNFYEPYIFKDGVTVYIADSTLFPADKTCTPEQLDFYLRMTNADLKPNTGRYARICSTTREQYYNNGGTVQVGNSDTDRSQVWLEVVRELYKQAWNSDRNELMIAWARMNL